MLMASEPSALMGVPPGMFVREGRRECRAMLGSIPSVLPFAASEEICALFFVDGG